MMMALRDWSAAFVWIISELLGFLSLEVFIFYLDCGYRLSLFVYAFYVIYSCFLTVYLLGGIVESLIKFMNGLL